MVEIADKRVEIGKVHLENRIVAVITEWARRFPNELVALDKQVKAHRRESQHSKAITPMGCLLHKAEIPVSLAKMLNKGVARNWLYDHEIRRLVLRNFKVGLINRSSEMMR